MTFDRAFQLLLKHEGGYSNHPNDPGGSTKFGISQARYPGLDIRNLTVGQAKAIYFHDYWERYRCGDVPWPIGCVLFDCCVNHNPLNPVRWLQEAVDVKRDGIIGPVTVAAANRSDAVDVAKFMTQQRVEYVKHLSNYPTFGKGWHRRHIDVLVEAVRHREAT